MSVRDVGDVRLVGRALALVVSRTPEQQAVDELARAAGHDRRLLGEARQMCRLSSSGRYDMPEVARAQQFLEMAAAAATAATAAVIVATA